MQINPCTSQFALWQQMSFSLGYIRQNKLVLTTTVVKSYESPQTSTFTSILIVIFTEKHYKTSQKAIAQSNILFASQNRCLKKESFLLAALIWLLSHFRCFLRISNFTKAKKRHEPLGNGKKNLHHLTFYSKRLDICFWSLQSFKRNFQSLHWLLRKC